jgi:hypothetical protein
VQVFFDEDGSLHLGSKLASDPIVVATKLITTLRLFVPALTALVAMISAQQPALAPGFATVDPGATLGLAATSGTATGAAIAVLNALRDELNALQNLDVGSSIVQADP